MGSPKSVHGDINRHLGQDLFGRLHIYPSLSAANADVGTAEARLIYLADQKAVFYGVTGGWVQVAAGSGTSGIYTSPGALPVGTVVSIGDIVGAVSLTGDITFVGPLAGLGVNVGDYIVVSGSLDSTPAAFLDGAFPVNAIDTLTEVINVGVAAFPAPVLPVSLWGSAIAYVGAPSNGTLAVVNPDSGIGGGLAVWAFNSATNTWVRIIDEDGRVAFIDGSRPFTAFPTVDGVAMPTADRELITKDYSDGQLSGHVNDSGDPHAAAGYLKVTDPGPLNDHIADVADPHLAAGYAKTADVPAMIDSNITSRNLVTTIEANALIAAHDVSPAAHGGVIDRIDELMNTINSVNATASILIPVDLGVVAAANGIPLTMVNGVCVPITTEDENVFGVLETYSATVAVGTCNATGSAVNNTVTLNSGLIGTNFIPGNGYAFPGISAVLLVVRRIEGNVLFMEGPVPTVGPVAGIAVVEHPGSSVVLFGILQIPSPESRLTAADIVSIRRDRPASGVAWVIEVGAAWSLASVKVGDQVVITGHVGSPFRNGTYTVGYIDAPNRVLGFLGTAVTVIPAQNAEIVALTNGFVFAAPISTTRLRAGMSLVVTGSALGNNGTYLIDVVDRLNRTINVAPGFAFTDEAVVTVTVTDTQAMPVDSPDYPLEQVLVGNVYDNVIEVNGTTKVVSVTKGSVPFAAAARVLSLSGVEPTDPSAAFAISVVDTSLVDRDRFTVPAITTLYTRPVGVWGVAGVLQWDTNNITDIIVDDAGRAKIIFTNAVLGLVQAGDSLTISGSVALDGTYEVHVVDSSTILHLTTVLVGVDELASAANAIITRNAIPSGAAAVDYLGATTAFDAATPAAPKPFYVDLTDAQLTSATGLGTTIGHQLDKFRFLVDPQERITYYNKHVVYTGTPFVPTMTHEVLIFDATGGVIVVNLPAITPQLDGKLYYLKAHAVGANSVTINRGGATDLIDGATSKSLAVIYDKLTIEAVYVTPTTSYWNIL